MMVACRHYEVGKHMRMGSSLAISLRVQFAMSRTFGCRSWLVTQPRWRCRTACVDGHGIHLPLRTQLWTRNASRGGMGRSTGLGDSPFQPRGRVLVASGAPAVDSIREWPTPRQQQQTSPGDDDAEGLNYRKELQAAIVAVTRACGVCTDVRQSWEKSQSKSNSKIEKTDKTPVTVADFAVQAVVALHLQAEGCHDPLVAEEDAKELRKDQAKGVRDMVVEAAIRRSDGLATDTDAVLQAIDWGCHMGDAPRHWVLDPIDGTVGFLKGGNCQYTVGLGLVEDGEIVVGCMGLPNWSLPINPYPRGDGAQSAALTPPPGGIIVFAAKGLGTWVRPLGKVYQDSSGDVRVEVRPETSLSNEGVLCISDHEKYDDLPMAAALGTAGRPSGIMPLCCGSLCKYAAVAVGSATAFIQHPVKGFPRLKAWDHVAGVVCVTEAGGRVSDLHGKDLPFGNGSIDFVPGGGGVAVTNGVSHDGLLAAAIGAGMWWRGPPVPSSSSLVAKKVLNVPLLVCIDRDGVINEDVGSPGVTDVKHFKLIQGSATAIAALNAAGCHVCVVTNQSCIGKGLMTPEGLVDIHKEMHAQLAKEGAWVDGILVACDVAAEEGSRRKPRPGMLHEAMTHFGVTPIEAVFIGDTVTDMQAAVAADIPRRMLMTTGHGAPMGKALEAEGITLPTTIIPSSGQFGSMPPEILPVTVHTDLESAVGLLLEHGTGVPSSSSPQPSARE